MWVHARYHRKWSPFYRRVEILPGAQISLEFLALWLVVKALKALQQQERWLLLDHKVTLTKSVLGYCHNNEFHVKPGTTEGRPAGQRLSPPSSATTIVTGTPATTDNITSSTS